MGPTFYTQGRVTRLAELRFCDYFLTKGRVTPLAEMRFCNCFLVQTPKVSEANLLAGLK